MSEYGASDLLGELATLATALAETVAPSALLDGTRSVTAVALMYFAAAACSVAVVDDDAEELIYVAASGAGADSVADVRLPIGRGIAGWVAQSGQPIAVSDLSGDTRFARDIAESTSYVPTALLVVPIEADDRLLGVLSVLDRDETRPGAAGDLQAAAQFADLAAAAIQATTAFADAGRVLLQALAEAAGSDAPLSAVLAAVPRTTHREHELHEFAAVLAEFYRSGANERGLGLRLLRDVLAFVNRDGGGRTSTNR